jgi:hypothetical protein
MESGRPPWPPQTMPATSANTQDPLDSQREIAGTRPHQTRSGSPVRCSNRANVACYSTSEASPQTAENPQGDPAP